MEMKNFLMDIETLSSLSMEKKTLRNRIKIKLIYRKLNKFIHTKAKAQAKVMYDKTVELYEEMIKTNLL